MKVLQVESLALVQNAIDAVRQVHGGYQAIDLLTKAMSEVDVPEEFDQEVEEAEKVSGMRYEGPDGAIRSLLKTLETAANESGSKQNALVELTSLVLVRLGSIQGSKILVGLLAIAGVNPAVGAVMVKVLLLLVQSEAGRRIVSQAWPEIQKYLGQLWGHSELRGELGAIANQVGEQGTTWLAQLSTAPQDIVNAVKDASGALMNDLSDIFLAQPVNPNKGDGPNPGDSDQ